MELTHARSLSQLFRRVADRLSRLNGRRILLALVVSIFLSALTSCIAGRPNNSGPVTISSFTASPTITTPGQPVILTWVVSGATSLSISDGTGPVSGAVAISGNSIQLSPTTTTTYTLTATGGSGSVSTITDPTTGNTAPASATVTVVPPPSISSFTATPSTISTGQSTTLSWSVSNAGNLSLQAQDNVTGSVGYQDVTGLTSIVEQPADSTTYTLTAASLAGTAGVTAQVTVTVNQVPLPVVMLSASNQNIATGETSILSWTAQNTVKLILQAADANHPAPGIQTDVTGESDLVVSPAITTTYSLVGTNSAGVSRTSNSVTVTVSACPPPNIYSFAATPPSTGAGNAVSLNAIFDSGATGASVTATVDNGIGTVTSGDPVATAVLTSSTTFNLTVTNTCGSKSTAAARVPVGSIALFAGQSLAGSQDGSTTNASFSSPQGMASDSSGNLYVADLENSTIRMITPAGDVTTLAGTPGMAGYMDGPPATALFNQPVGVAVDSAGNVYVADRGNNSIRMIAAGTGMVTTLAGDGSNSGGYQDGTGSAAEFNQPTSIAVDAGGTLYVTDTQNNNIRVVTSGGVVTTLAGPGPSASNQAGSGYQDGTGSEALFDQPTGIALNTDGNLYVTDAANYVIRKITLAGVVTTVAGQPKTSGYMDGPGSTAVFGILRAIVNDPSGNLYVADATNYVIRRLKIDNTSNLYDVDTIIGTASEFLVNPSGPLPGKFNAASGLALVPSSGNLYATVYNNIYVAPF